MWPNSHKNRTGGPFRGIVTTPRVGGEGLFDPDAPAPHPMALSTPASRRLPPSRLQRPTGCTELKRYRLIVRRDGKVVQHRPQG
jgi:hypothetical protein